jgi:hypothetical protein
MRREMNYMWIWLLHRDERGLNTAELLGNAALAIIALIAIWAALQALGLDIVSWIRTQLLGG